MSSLDDLGEKIRIILLSSCKKVNVHELVNLYYQSYEQALNFKKFGFNTLNECLESLPKYVKVQRNGYNYQLIPVVTEKFLDYENLISAPNRTVKGYEKRSRAIIVRGANQPQEPKTETSSFNFSKLDLSSLMEVEREVLESSYNDSVNANRNGSETNSNSVSQSNGYFSRPADQSMTKKDQVFRNDLKTRSWIKNENFNSEIELKIKKTKPFEAAKKKPFMSDDLRQKLFDLFAEHQTGIWLTEMMDFFERKYNESLRKFLGTESILSFCRAHTDVFQIERFKSDWRTFSTKQTIPDNLHKLVSTCPTKVMNSRKNARPDVVVSALPDDFDLRDYINDIEFKQMSNARDLNTTTKEENLITPPPSPPPPKPWNDTRTKNSYHQLNLIYPADVATQQDFIEKPCIPADWCKFRYLFEIKILEIINPSQFWICISKKDVYNNIIDQVEQFYKEKSSLYAMKICHVHENHYCVVSYAKNEKENAFRRCKILSFNDVTECVKVFLIDMGIEMNASISSIYYLRKEFLGPLQQAISVKLHKFESEAGTRMFRELTGNSRLYAVFKEVTDKKQFGIEMYACNNSTSYCINVATELTMANKNI